MNYLRVMKVLVVLSVMPAIVLGQSRRQASGGDVMPPYDVSQEMTVSGTVVETVRIGDDMDFPMTVLVTEVSDRMLHVFLGPADFVEAQEFGFNAGVAVTVWAIGGFRFDGEAAMMARKVVVGDATLELRDADGEPKWK